MKPTVSILAPGVMGAAIATRLANKGLEVRTTLSGRSQQTCDRAHAAGMAIVAENAVADVDFVLSIVPPRMALALAQDLAPILARAKRKPVYVDCNAINPQTVAQVAAVVVETGAAFVDGSIIGRPPEAGHAGPTIYVSGECADSVEILAQFGLLIRVLAGRAGAASALKMSYGGITKGLIALGSAMILGAEKAGVSGFLYDEMARSQPHLLQGFSKSVPDMFSKAGRWVAEMEEISGFLGGDTPQGRLFGNIAALYDDLAEDRERASIAALTDFFDRAR